MSEHYEELFGHGVACVFGPGDVDPDGGEGHAGRDPGEAGCAIACGAGSYEQQCGFALRRSLPRRRSNRRPRTNREQGRSTFP
jgi:hypothetical protein